MKGGFGACLPRGASAVVVLFALAGCGQIPVTQSPGHIKADEPRPAGAIPAPVQTGPVLPPPKPAARVETYSVVVNSVRVQDLLFALARDAKLNVDIHSGVSGTVTLNAIDQTLPQLLGRIAKQVDMRYEVDGPNLTVMRDTPYLRNYRIDYVNLTRDARSTANLSTQVSGSGAPGASASAAQNNATAVINTVTVNKFWETLEKNVKDILRETDKIVQLTPQAAPAAAVAPAGAQAGGAVPAAAAPAAPPPSQPSVEFREAASVIANAEAGVLTIRATSRQHEKIQEFLDQVMVNVRRQVLIEATVVEVTLKNEYQRGIDWQRLRTGAASVGLPSFGTGQSGAEFRQLSPATPAALDTVAFVFGGAITSLNFNVAIRLLETFGEVRVLSSPKISVLNNQLATLKVVDNLVYFTIQATTTQAQTTALTTFTTTLNTVPVGFIMSVVPQISENDSITLGMRPIISRQIGVVSDPNPSLAAAGVTSNVPVIQSREMESILSIQSGQVAVLGGLMQDQRSLTEDTIPGVNRVPGLGTLLEQRKDKNDKTELVIFLRATVIRDPSIEGDYRRLRELMPGQDYFTKPNPGQPPVLQ
jgi:general secretion pathway protein D